MNIRWTVLSVVSVMVLSFLPENALARRGRSDLYFNGGFAREFNTYKIGANESNFSGWGTIATLGTELEVSNDFGLLLEAEYARLEMLNALQNTNYLEKSINNVWGAKVGLFYGWFSIGGGIAKNRIDIDNVQSGSSGIRTSFDGLTYGAFGQLTLPTEAKVRPVVEAKYSTGSLNGMSYNELQISIRLQFNLL